MTDRILAGYLQEKGIKEEFIHLRNFVEDTTKEPGSTDPDGPTESSTTDSKSDTKSSTDSKTDTKSSGGK